MTVTPASRPDRSAEVKDKIRASAERLFTADGFDATGIRDIAADAGVNPAIVIRHFSSKERLFVETVDANTSWSSALDGPLDDIGRRLVRAVIAGRRNGLQVFGAIVRASGRADVRSHLQASLAEQFVGPLAARFAGADAELRAHLFAAQATGLMFALSVYDDEFLIAAPTDDVVELYGAALQRLATG